MKIVLINPADEYRARDSRILDLGISGSFAAALKTVLNRGMTEDRNEPVGILYLAAILREKGFDVSVVDQNIQSKSSEEVCEEIESAEIVGLSITGANQLSAVTEIVSLLRQSESKSFIVLGGTFATFASEFLLNKYDSIDCVVRGESEITFTGLVEKIAGSRDWRGLPGVCYRDSEGIRIAEVPPLIEDLDTISFPARDLLLDVHNLGNRATVLSSRGCWSQCSYCTSHELGRLAHGSLLRSRSPENVLDELDYIYNEFGIKKFRFVDDNFVGPGRQGRERALGIARGIECRGKGYTYFANFRSHVIDKNLIIEMVNTGMDSMGIGIESFSQTQLDRYGKNVKVEDNFRTIDVAVKYGPKKLNLGCIPFDPDTKIDELLIQLDVLKQYPFFETSKIINKLIVLPGTRIESELRENSRLQGSCENYSYSFSNAKVTHIYDVVYPFIGRISIIEMAVKEWGNKHLEARAEVDIYNRELRLKSVNFFQDVINAIDDVSADDSKFEDIMTSLKSNMAKKGNELFQEVTGRALRLSEQYPDFL